MHHNKMAVKTGHHEFKNRIKKYIFHNIDYSNKLDKAQKRREDHQTQQYKRKVFLVLKRKILEQVRDQLTRNNQHKFYSKRRLIVWVSIVQIMKRMKLVQRVLG